MGLALAAFGMMHGITTEPLLKKLLRYVMSDEARHVAFGVLSFAGLRLHPLSVLFLLHGSAMISKTLRIPKP